MSKQSDFSEKCFLSKCIQNYSLKKMKKFVWEIFSQNCISNAKSEIDQGISKWNRFKHQIKAKFYLKCCLCQGIYIAWLASMSFLKNLWWTKWTINSNWKTKWKFRQLLYFKHWKFPICKVWVRLYCRLSIRISCYNLL